MRTGRPGVAPGERKCDRRPAAPDVAMTTDLTSGVPAALPLERGVGFWCTRTGGQLLRPAPHNAADRRWLGTLAVGYVSPYRKPSC